MLCLIVGLTACGKTSSKKKDPETINYKVLVNKLHKLPSNWEDALETTSFVNTVGDKVEVENKAYTAYKRLKASLEEDGIKVDLDSARRSVKEQQRIMNDFIKEYGEDYAKKTVAQPGYSEHHTGLALDLYLIVDGKDITENEDMIKYTKIWSKIHKKLADYGFILRYLKDMEHITGYGYEPWHIRYIDDVETAKKIMDSGETFENYLGAAKDTKVKVYNLKSKVYSKKALKEAVVQIKCDFASWKGCELHSLKYAGDQSAANKNLKWLNSLDKNNKYKSSAEFLGNFHSPKDVKGTSWEANKEYKDYQWWLGHTKDDEWDIASTGY